MMKFVLLMSAVVGLVVTQSEPFYQTVDDYVDMEAIVADLPSLQAYVDCYLDVGPCTVQTQSYKDILQDSITRGCDRCSVPQKQRYIRYLRGLKSRLPQDYQSFREKYDPMNIYIDALEEKLSEFADQPQEPRPSE